MSPASIRRDYGETWQQVAGLAMSTDVASCFVRESMPDAEGAAPGKMHDGSDWAG